MEQYSEKLELIGFNGIPVNVRDKLSIKPKGFNLLQNYPNPFNPSITIEYSIPKPSHVVIKIFDVLGIEVATLVNEEKPTGNYKVEFISSNLSSGIYFYRMEAGKFIETKKLLLLK
jgi:hypothetical protein